MPSTRWESTRHRDSGSVAVETAVVSLFLIILSFGIVESSFLFKDWLSVSAAARAGARMGASQPRVANFAQASADQVTNALSDTNSLSDLNPANLIAVWVFKTDATGSRPATCNSSSSCVPFTWDGTQLKLTTASAGNWLSTSQDACAGDSGRDSLGVYVSYAHISPLGFFPNSTISQSTVMWIEPWTGDVHCKPGA